jgi:manganese-dependent ADP-ribose/CDP-alcohol diphosphatase
MKIGLIADPHYCSREVLCGRRRPILSLRKLQDAVREFRRQGVELIICLGDLVDSDESMEKNRENLKLASSVLTDSGIECRLCMGNHDAFIFDKEEFRDISGIALAPAIIEKNDNTLILLDANCNLDGSEYRRGDLDWEKTLVPERQVLWLEKTLNECEGKNAYIFVHQNLDPAVDARHIIHNAPEIRRILKMSGKVRGVCQGHYHPGASNIHDGIPYITLKAMCEAAEDAFMIIDI